MRQVSKAIRQAVDKVKWDNRWTRSVSEQVNVVNQTTGGQGHAIGSWARKLFQTAGKQGQSERWKVRQDVHKVSQTGGGQSHHQFDLIFLSLFIYIFVMIIIYKLVSSLHPTILHEIIYTFLFSIISGFFIFQMPQLDSSSLQGHRELFLAHLQLSNISAGYVWGCGDDNVVKVCSFCSFTWGGGEWKEGKGGGMPLVSNNEVIMLI